MADVLADTLVALGVEVVFVLPGGTIAPLIDALLDHPTIRTINARTEAGAMFAAAAYARHSGRPGVVLVTSGPGAINTMTGLASAQRDGAPVMVIAGDVAQTNNGRNALQDGSAHGLDIVSVARPLCARTFNITRPDNAEPALRIAFQTMLDTRRSAVFVNIPMDVGMSLVPSTGYTSDWAAPVRDAPAPSDAAIAAAANLLARAKRPLIVAGSGARQGKGPDVLRRVAEHFAAPVVTTPKGKGVLPETHALSLGVFGHGGHPSAAEYVQKGADVALVLGSALGDAATNGWDPKLAGEALIHVDVDATQFGRSYRPTIALHGTVECVGERLVAAAPPTSRSQTRHGVSFFTDAATSSARDGTLAPQRALFELQRALPEDTIFTSDIGEHLMFATHYLRVVRPDGYTVMTGLASMATGIAGAVGAKLAKPDRTVAAICGDGCFVMSIGDVISAASEKLDIVIAVLNDARYGMVELGLQALYGRTPAYALGPVDIAALARGCGVEAHVIQRPADLAELGLMSKLAKGPVVLDIRIDATIAMPKNKRFENLSRAGQEGVS